MAQISLLGVYNMDPTIFDQMELPTAADIDPNVDTVRHPFIPDKDDMINYLLMECRGLGLWDPDPADMKHDIGVWSRIRRKTWCDLYNTLLYKYNPIWNKDGGYTDTRKQVTEGTTSGNGSSENQVTGYDTNSYSPNEKDVNTYSNTGRNTEDETFTHSESGNIGVTTTQQMIREQREVVEFNLYDYIAKDFKNRFCLQLY